MFVHIKTMGKRISEDFEYFWRFPLCVGGTGGKHVIVQRQWIQARNQLGTPGGAKSFLRRAQIFKLFPIASNYVQHIFPGGANNFGPRKNYRIRHGYPNCVDHCSLRFKQNLLRILTGLNEIFGQYHRIRMGLDYKMKYWTRLGLQNSPMRLTLVLISVNNYVSIGWKFAVANF